MNKTITWSKLINILRDKQPIILGDYPIDYIIPKEDSQEVSLIFTIDEEDTSVVFSKEKNENIDVESHQITLVDSIGEEIMVGLFEMRAMNLVD